MTDRPRAHNSTLPVPAKGLERRTPLSTSSHGKSPAARKRREDRKALEFRRVYHSEERVLFVKFGLRCAVAGCESRPENAHLNTEGTSRKSGYLRVVPLCRGHHRIRTDSLHQLGSVERFDERHDTDLEPAAWWAEREWQEWGRAWIEQCKADGSYEVMKGCCQRRRMLT